MANIILREITFQAGSSVSDAVDVQTSTLLALYIPSGWPGSTISFQVSRLGTTFNDCYDRAGAELVIPVAPLRFVALDAGLGLGFGPWLRLRSGTAAAPVALAGLTLMHIAYRQFE